MGVSGGLRWPPKTLCRALLLLLNVTTVIVGIRGQGCSSNVALPSKIPVTTTKCTDITTPSINYDLTFRYTQDTTAQTLSVIASVPIAKRWFAVGFNSVADRMEGTSAIIFWADSTTGAGVVNTYYISSEQTATGVLVDNTTTHIKYTVPPQIFVTTETLYVAFEVDQSTSALFTNQNFAVGALNDVPSGNTITTSTQPHQDETSIAINYNTSAVAVQDSGSSSLQNAHGILNIVGWGVLLPIGAIIARYARGYDPTWFYMHAVLQILGYILIIAGLVTGFKLEDQNPGLDDIDTHKALAIFVFVLASIQISAVLIRPKKEAKLRRYWNWGHWWLGRTALVIAAINIFVGIHVAAAGRKWKLGYGIILGLELLTLIPLEILLWVNYRRARHESRLPQTSMQRREPAFDATAPRSPPPYVATTNWDGKY